MSHWSPEGCFDGKGVTRLHLHAEAFLPAVVKLQRRLLVGQNEHY